MLRPITLVLLMVAVSLTACTRKNQVRGAEAEIALSYKTKAIADKEDPRNVRIEVKNKGDDLNAVRETARYAASVYCIKKLGSSEKEWRLNATKTDWLVTRSEKTLSVYARCTAR